MKFFVTILTLFSLLGCAAQLDHWAEPRGSVSTITGDYRVYEANCLTVQDLWEKRRGYTLEVEAFTDWDRGEIWYCTDVGLEAELENIQSYKNLREAAIRDSEIANPK